ncbi:MAG: glycosyltransferase [Candidatus Methylumidiphilus sp.]
MDTFLLALSAFAAAVWFIVQVLPWRPWLHSETLEPKTSSGQADLSGLTVLIPARNEADQIGTTLTSLAGQGSGLRVVLVDDGSDDGTADTARQSADGLDLRIIEGQPLRAGWSGKLWALQQGLGEVGTDWTLLLDADIQLRPGMAAALLDKAQADNRPFVSIMAYLRMESAWEKLLMPAFIYFFKLLYPFRLANSEFRHVAAAAGGCILVQTQVLAGIGGFASIQGAIIDDCTLAKRVKQAGHRIWIGQSHAVISARPYDGLGPIWEMVARSAFTQLRYSVWLLALCNLLIVSLFLGPVAGLLLGDANTRALALTAYLTMAGSYLPSLRYYGRNPAWALLLPGVAAFYLAMTWTSAIRYWRGDRSRWKNRVYAAE